ncbi:MAG: hypothetical protein KDJ38_20265 [Gammaproteobacteria bacterium]|nr:hypothetical protein [Gammaproteobacteria bacterium]
MRVKAKWNKKDKLRTPAEIAGALAFTGWKIASEVVLDLENEGFETQTQSQRLDVIAEVMYFMVAVVDRLVFDRFDQDERAEFVTAFALSFAETMQDNRTDASGPGDYKPPFIALLNERAAEYADCSFSKEEGAGFPMRRILGGHVMNAMGERDRKWIPDYIIDLEAPKVVATLKRAMPTLFM